MLVQCCRPAWANDPSAAQLMRVDLDEAAGAHPQGHRYVAYEGCGVAAALSRLRSCSTDAARCAASEIIIVNTSRGNCRSRSMTLDKVLWPIDALCAGRVRCSDAHFE